jgi:hypothetical protein
MVVIVFEYHFIVMYKLGKIRVVVDALSRLLISTQPMVCLIKAHMQVYFI